MRNTFLDNSRSKNAALKKAILRICIENGEQSIGALSEKLDSSVPTVTKLISELMEDGFMVDLGKQGSAGGRRPSVYGLNPDAGYFVGVDIRNTHAGFAVTDFKGNLVNFQDDIPFTMEKNEESVREIATSVRRFFADNQMDWERVLGLGISLAGRVNRLTGYSNNYSFDPDRSIASILEEELEVPVILENDSRAMTYGEFICGTINKEQNVLFVNVSWGLGMGMVLDGRLFYGASGYSGEFGHFPLLDNDVMCRCGKIGCLETGASGSAVVRLVTEQLKAGRSSLLRDKFKKEGKVNLNDIFKAIKLEDVLSIEVVEKVGETLGRALAGLINIFNPELVVIGGKLAMAGDYLLLPIRSTVKKYAQNLVNRDTTIKFSTLKRQAAPMGDCMLSRSHLLGVL